MAAKKLFLFLSLFLIIGSSIAQENWMSSRFNYSIEIPEGFNPGTIIGSNVDFKATKDQNSIVVVIKELPPQYHMYSIWEILGNLSTFGEDWETGAQEYLNSPQFLKYRKTEIDGTDAFWFDYTTDNSTIYSKVYQTQKNNKIYTFTLTCRTYDYNNYSSVWYRFKNKIIL